LAVKNFTTGKGISVTTQMTFPLALQTVWIAIHVVGLLMAWLARLHADSETRWVAQAGFFLFLPIVAVLTIAGQFLCVDGWLLSAITLTAMIVMAIVDFGTDRNASATNEI